MKINRRTPIIQPLIFILLHVLCGSLIGENGYVSPLTGTGIDRSRLERFHGKDAKFIADKLTEEGIEIVYWDPQRKATPINHRKSLTEKETAIFSELLEQVQRDAGGDFDKVRAEIPKEMENLTVDARAIYVEPYAHLLRGDAFVPLPFATKPKILILTHDGLANEKSNLLHEYAHHLFIQESRPTPLEYGGEKYAAREVLPIWLNHYRAEARSLGVALGKSPENPEKSRELVLQIAKNNLATRIVLLKQRLLHLMDEAEVYLFQIEHENNPDLSDEESYSQLESLVLEIASQELSIDGLGNLNAPDNKILRSKLEEVGPDLNPSKKNLADEFEGAKARIREIRRLLLDPKSKSQALIRKFERE